MSNTSPRPPDRRRLRVLLVPAAACTATAVLCLAPTAQAVTPTSATATYDCGSWGSGLATLTPGTSGTTKTIKFTTSASSIQIPAGYSADPNSITTTVKFTKTSGTTTSTVQFSGTVNPGMVGPVPVTLGALPLTSGTLATGDKTDSYQLSPPASSTNWSLQLTTSSPTSATVQCVATSLQSAPFVW
ncbi:hypothetical protein AB0L71_29515 [Streptomyces sp. NPDC052052]|uniref:hypothetical protein n=1 Tax=Streptomyces sp. NPDC052052 TaxID=3154756 RepID=UPI00342E7C7B